MRGQVLTNTSQESLLRCGLKKVKNIQHHHHIGLIPFGGLHVTGENSGFRTQGHPGALRVGKHQLDTLITLESGGPLSAFRPLTGVIVFANDLQPGGQ